MDRREPFPKVLLTDNCLCTNPDQGAGLREGSRADSGGVGEASSHTDEPFRWGDTCTPQSRSGKCSRPRLSNIVISRTHPDTSLGTNLPLNSLLLHHLVCSCAVPLRFHPHTCAYQEAELGKRTATFCFC